VEVVVVEAESHLISAAINSGYSDSEGHDQLVHAREQDISQNGSLQMSPQSFDRIQAWAVGSQPIDFDSIGIVSEALLDRLCVMESGMKRGRGE
jgi:hypothetical protein